MARTYMDAMNELRFSDEQKARMADALTDAALATGAEVIPMQARRRRSVIAKVAAAVVAVTLMGGGAAYAAGSYVSVGQFARALFEGAPATELEGTVGRPVGAAVSSGGVTVTADAIIGDAQNLAVVYSVARDDGKPFDLPRSANGDATLPVAFDREDVAIAGVAGMGGDSYFYDEDPTDNAIQFVQRYFLSDVAGGSVAGRHAHVELSGLKALAGSVAGGAAGDAVSVSESRVGADGADAADGGADGGPGDGATPYEVVGADGNALVEQAYTVRGGDAEDAGEVVIVHADDEETVLADGSWSFDLLLDYEDASVPFETGASFRLDGERATVTRASVSPIALTLAYDGERGAGLGPDAASGELPEDFATSLRHYLQLDDLRLVLADGSEVLVEDDGGGSLGTDGGVAHVEKGAFLTRMLDVDEVVALKVNGTRIPVSR